MSWRVRTAGTGDRDSIIAVVADAFTTGGRDGSEEVAIVRDTWALGATAEGLDLVAVDDHGVVGHVLGATGHLGDRPVVGIAPLSVASARQNEGIGTALMHEVLDRAETAGEPLVVLLGLPAYYLRFGFEASGPLGIWYPSERVVNPHFLVRRFAPYDATYTGLFTYCWEDVEASAIDN